MINRFGKKLEQKINSGIHWSSGDTKKDDRMSALRSLGLAVAYFLQKDRWHAKRELEMARDLWYMSRH